MVELMVKLGPKGQVVIPKIFRESYKLYPEQSVIIAAEKEGVLIKQAQKDIVKELEKIAREATKRRNGRPFVYKKEEMYEQYEKRAKRAGIKL